MNNKLFSRIHVSSLAFEVLLAILFMICFSHFANASTIESTEKLISTEISKTAGFENAGVKLVKGQAYLNTIKTDKLEISQLNVDNDKRIFTGYISANGGMPIFVSGRFYKSQQVPVLNRNVTRTDVIAPQDIAYIEMDAEKIGNQNYVSDVKDMIGKSPTHSIYKNRPVTKQQLGSAVLITKQQDVTILFRAGNIEIKDMGVAVDDGAEGDVIRIRNKTSNKVISATVLDGKTAVISRSEDKLAKL